MQINITASNNLTPTRKTLMINVCVCVCVRARAHAQLRLTFCDPKDYTPPGSSVQGISQARVLQWVTISCWGWGVGWSSLPRDQTHISCISCISRQILYLCVTWNHHIPLVGVQNAKIILENTLVVSYEVNHNLTC